MSHEHLETFTEPGGHHRPLGFTPPSVEIEQNLLMMGCEPVTVGEQLIIPLVPPNDWEEFDVRRNPNYPIQVKDQDGKGACNGHATATAMELARYFNGQPHVALSGWFPYALLCNGVDRGSSIGEALGVVTKRGLSPESDVPYGIIHPQKLTSEAHSSAQHYKCVVGMRIQTWDQLMSAVQLRMGGINLSIKVGKEQERLLMHLLLMLAITVQCPGGTCARPVQSVTLTSPTFQTSVAVPGDPRLVVHPEMAASPQTPAASMPTYQRPRRQRVRLFRGGFFRASFTSR